MLNLVIDEKTINITKLDTDEYEFKMINEYIEYFGYSFLKNLKFPRLDKYFRHYEQIEEIKLYEFENGYKLEFPIPYHDEFEVVVLKRKEMTEIDELKITIQKNNDIIDEYKKEIDELSMENINILKYYNNLINEKNKEIDKLNKVLTQIKNDDNHLLDTICNYLDELFS